MGAGGFALLRGGGTAVGPETGAPDIGATETTRLFSSTT
jgi:hypothetical protein